MKKILGFVMMTAVMLSSCGNDHEDLYDPAMAAKLKANQYAEAFHAIYGDVAPNHTWGFGSSLSSRGANSNGNQWWENMEVPSPVSESEIQTVYNYFANPKNYTESVHINWSDFFVQQVYKGTTEYKALDGESVSTVLGSDKMNQLMTEYADEQFEKIPNFNAGKCGDGQNVYTDNSNYYKDGIAFMTNSGTLKFAYENSLDGGNLYFDYIIQEVDGNFYVAFDFKSDSPTAKVEADGVYTDWIVKISPAIYKEKEHKTSVYRIIAEDLGAVGDFDFNDVVFDVAIGNIYDGSSQITVHAAGGTLPLYINGVEIHELFGVSTDVMVNTGKGVEREPAIFKLTNVWSLKEVVITVEDQNVGTYNLKAECGEAPQKICVPTTYQWTQEQQSIDAKYPKFKDWVGNEAINWLN